MKQINYELERIKQITEARTYAFSIFFHIQTGITTTITESKRNADFNPWLVLCDIHKCDN